MRAEILEILRCPHCAAGLNLASAEYGETEIRSGLLVCSQNPSHTFEVTDGIITFATQFDHHLVREEVEYSAATFHGDERLTSPQHVASYPETLSEIWPETQYFGQDFRALLEHLNLAPQTWTLDVGTGACWTSRILAEHETNVIALDVVETAFNGLRTADIQFEAYDVYFERILESMTKLPFREACIDQVVFQASFHHSPDEQKTLLETFRILKPGGVAAIGDDAFVSLRHWLFQTNGGETVEGAHHYVPYGRFHRMAQHAGFQVEFLLADHVRERLSGLPFGSLVSRMLEAVPILLKQFNSSLVLLRKPVRRFQLP